MDQKTRQLRRRNKLANNKRGELPDFEARGLGRKNKPADTFPTRICSHIDGGKEIFIKVKRTNRKPGESPYANVKIIKGGIRCPQVAIIGTHCLDHLSSNIGPLGRVRA